MPQGVLALKRGLGIDTWENMDAQLVDSLVQAICALLAEERAALEDRLFFVTDEPTTDELATLALKGGSFDFLAEEADLYSCEDGEPIDTVC